MFDRHEMLVEPVLVCERGDTLADALERVEAITPDPAAGRGHLEAIKVDLGAVALMPKGMLSVADIAWVIECRETHLQELVIYPGHNKITNALFILRSQRKGPLRALRMTAPDPAALPTDDIDGWLPQRAPHIHRIG
jgi:hypothetical protein